MVNATNLLFGKTRQAILSRLFDLPVSSLYVRELSRHTGISPGALQHELKQLLAADLILREQDGNRVTYRANTTHPIYPDLLNLVRKTCGLSRQIKGALEPLADHIEFAAIYGSTAKHRDHSRSDVDLLIVGQVSLSQILDAVSHLESQFDREINVRVYSPEHFRQFRHEEQNFLQVVLAGPLEILMGGINDT